MENCVNDYVNGMKISNYSNLRTSRPGVCIRNYHIGSYICYRADGPWMYMHICLYFNHFAIFDQN